MSLISNLTSEEYLYPSGISFNAVTFIEYSLNSVNNTKQILVSNNIHHLSLPVNLGIGGAVQTGFKYALRNGFDIAIQMDGDGQHPPCELEKIISPLLIPIDTFGEKEICSDNAGSFSI